jgi:hypothetical protein
MKKVSVFKRLEQLKKDCKKKNLSDKEQLLNSNISRLINNFEPCEDQIQIPKKMVTFIP